MDNINQPLSIRANDPDLNIEIDIIPSKDKVLNQQLTDLKSEINILDNKINKLESHADMADYLVAVGCGFVSGMVDALFGNSFSINSGSNDAKLLLSNSISENINNGSSITDSVSRGVVDWNSKMLKSISLNPNAPIKGVPSNISSNLAELASLKPFQSKNSITEFSKFTNEILEENKGSFLGIENYNDKLIKLGNKCIPVLLNEILVRTYYFIRRLIMVIKDNKIKSIKELNKDLIKKTIPFNNRTIVRMMSVSTSIMTAIDLGASCLEASISSPIGMSFSSKFILNINFIGIGRTAVAVTTDAVMGVKLHNSRKNRMKLMNEYNSLVNKSIFYKQGDMWVNAINVDSAINSSADMAIKASDTLKDAISSNKDDLRNIGKNSKKLDVNNPGLKDEIKDIIDWE